jgi:hypothetical protein
MNTELDRYNEVTADQLVELSRKLFEEKNSHTLFYRAK